MTPRSLVAATLLTALSCASAQAHIVGSRLGDFYAGALHPLTSLEDAVLWLAAGLLAGSQGPSKARWLVPLFPAGLLLGLLAGFRLGGAVAAPAADAGMMIALGLLLAAAPRLPAAALGAAAFALAVMRGLANAGGTEPGSDRVLFAAGFTLCGYAAITLVMAAVAAFRRSGAAWRPIALRAAGSWIAAIGVMLGGYALAAP